MADSPRAEFGRMAENLALRYLQKQKLTLLERNFRSRFGEIDLIMRENDTIIFVEVRARKTAAFLHPAESVNHTKRNKIRKTSQVFMLKNVALDRFNLRFDVIALTGSEARGMKIEWFKAAF